MKTVETLLELLESPDLKKPICLKGHAYKHQNFRGEGDLEYDIKDISWRRDNCMLIKNKIFYLITCSFHQNSLIFMNMQNYYY